MSRPSHIPCFYPANDAGRRVKNQETSQKVTVSSGIVMSMTSKQTFQWGLCPATYGTYLCDNDCLHYGFSVDIKLIYCKCSCVVPDLIKHVYGILLRTSTMEYSSSWEPVIQQSRQYASRRLYRVVQKFFIHVN